MSTTKTTTTRDLFDQLNQHVAEIIKERDGLQVERVRLLEAAKVLIAMDNCNYDRDQMRRSGGFDALRDAVAAIEPDWIEMATKAARVINKQRSTSA